MPEADTLTRPENSLTAEKQREQIEKIITPVSSHLVAEIIDPRFAPNAAHRRTAGLTAIERTALETKKAESLNYQRPQEAANRSRETANSSMTAWLDSNIQWFLESTLDASDPVAQARRETLMALGIPLDTNTLQTIAHEFADYQTNHTRAITNPDGSQRQKLPTLSEYRRANNPDLTQLEQRLRLFYFKYGSQENGVTHFIATIADSSRNPDRSFNLIQFNQRIEAMHDFFGNFGHEEVRKQIAEYLKAYVILETPPTSPHKKPMIDRVVQQLGTGDESHPSGEPPPKEDSQKQLDPKQPIPLPQATQTANGVPNGEPAPTVIKEASQAQSSEEYVATFEGLTPQERSEEFKRHLRFDLKIFALTKLKRYRINGLSNDEQVELKKLLQQSLDARSITYDKSADVDSHVGIWASIWYPSAVKVITEAGDTASYESFSQAHEDIITIGLSFDKRSNETAQADNKPKPLIVESSPEANVSLISIQAKEDDSIGVQKNNDGTISIVVADGVSGTALPKVASRLAVIKALQEMESNNPDKNTVIAIQDEIQEQNVALMAASQGLLLTRLADNRDPNIPGHVTMARMNTASTYAENLHKEYISDTTLALGKYNRANGNFYFDIRGDTTVVVLRADGSSQEYTGKKDSSQVRYRMDQAAIHKSDDEITGFIELDVNDVVMVLTDGMHAVENNYIEETRIHLMSQRKAGKKNRLDQDAAVFLKELIKAKGAGDDVSVVTLQHIPIPPETLSQSEQTQLTAEKPQLLKEVDEKLVYETLQGAIDICQQKHLGLTGGRGHGEAGGIIEEDGKILDNTFLSGVQLEQIDLLAKKTNEKLQGLIAANKTEYDTFTSLVAETKSRGIVFLDQNFIFDPDATEISLMKPSLKIKIPPVIKSIYDMQRILGSESEVLPDFRTLVSSS